MSDEEKPKLSNIREFLGWMIGLRVVDVTAGDPPHLPDADPEDDDLVTIHLDNGGYVSFSTGEGFYYDDNKPGEGT